MGNDIHSERLSKADIKLLQYAISVNDYETAYEILWRERPVSMRQFMLDEDFLGSSATTHPRILQLAEAIDLPEIRHAHLNIGKGSGKTYLIARAMLARGVYLQLCYRDPHAIFDLARGTELLSINLSTATLQAHEALFAELKSAIEHSKWFEGKYVMGNDKITFPNNIKCICGHSKGQSFEGLAIWRGALDESNLQRDKIGKSNADENFNILVEGGVSRFPGAYKVFTIGRSVHDNDFESRRQEQIANKGMKLKTSFFDNLELPGKKELQSIAVKKRKVSEHKFSTTVGLHPDDYPTDIWFNGNEMAVKGPTWFFNPTRGWESFKDEFERRPERASAVYGCRPIRGGVNRVFPNPNIIIKKSTERLTHPFDVNQLLLESFQPGPFLYYAHFDLSAKKDCTGFALCHVDQDRNKIVIDAMLEIPVPPGGELRLAHNRKLLYELNDRGFEIKVVSFDGWQSLESRQELSIRGFNVEYASVDRTSEGYDTLVDLMYDNKLEFYYYHPFYECCRDLIYISKNGKVDHDPEVPDSKKDVSDAVAAVCSRCVHELRGFTGIIAA